MPLRLVFGRNWVENALAALGSDRVKADVIHDAESATSFSEPSTTTHVGTAVGRWLPILYHLFRRLPFLSCWLETPSKQEARSML